jgi:hypothetical protein
MESDKNILNLSTLPVSCRKKNCSKKCEPDKITEKIEGGIIVRRSEGLKIEPR